MCNKTPLPELVQRSQTGDHQAFTELVRRFQDMAVGYARSIVGDNHAEDVAQEAFVTAWSQLPRLIDTAAFPGWLRRIIFTRATRITRRHQPETTGIDDVTAGDATEATARDDAHRVPHALAGLPEEERLAVVLFYFGAHTHEAIGDFLDIPASTVNNRLRTARKRLRKEILTMAEDTLGSQTPSRNSNFLARIEALTQPDSMRTNRYIYGPHPVDGHLAWALFCAAAAGDLARTRSILDRDPQLVNAQYWYQFPLHMAVREGHVDLVQMLLERGANPGQSRYQ